MDINIIDKFISNSITFIQKSIKTNKSEKFINESLIKDINKINENKNIRNILIQITNICTRIYLLVKNKIKITAKISETETNKYIFQNYEKFKIIKELLEINDIKSIFIEIDKDDKYLSVKDIINEFGEEKINIIINNKKNSDDYLAFFLIYLFIYIKDYRIKIFNQIEKSILKNSSTKIIKYFTTDITKVDYATIYDSLPTEIKNKANDFYEMLYNIINKVNIDYSIIKKKYLLFSKLLIPIVEDFQRVHKSGSVRQDSDTIEEITEKRGQTIVKQILSDIRSKQDFYNNSDKVNKNLFPSVLEKVNGVFYDEILELKIFSKIESKLMINNENYELYRNLENIRKYNFINFISNPNVILNYETNKLIMAIRKVSIDNFDKFKRLERRVIINDIIGDIVSFGIKHPQINFNEIKNINYDYKNANVGNISKLIEKLFLDKQFFNKNKFTLFIYNMKSKDSKTNIQIINDNISLLFKYYEEIIYSTIISKLQNYNKSFNNMYDFNKELNLMRKQFHIFKPHNINNSKLQVEIYNHFNDQIKDEYDEKEDYIPGLFNKLLLLPEYKERPKKKYQKLKICAIADDKDENTTYNDLSEKYLCQHFISWKELIRNRKNNPNKYNQLLFEFIKKYAKNVNNTYICKSCNYQLEVDLDITDSFQAGSANILAINLTTERSLEDLREYEKFSNSIKNIDKMVEKMASFYNFDNYIGSSNNSKKNRNEITKEVVDFIGIHNNTLRINSFNKRRQREKNAYIEYGINSELSNYFLFKLENDIFRFSSDDTDKFKRIKINNIFIIIMFCFFIRLSYNIFINVPINDKYCNYYFYEKFGDIIFKDLKILYDFKGTKKELNEIPNMKFYLFIMACTISKYKLWYPVPTKTLDAAIIKSIIHTFVDLYNTIIQVVMKKKKSYLYEYFAGKLYFIFKNVIEKPEYLSFVKQKSLKKIKTDFKNKKIKFIKSQVPNVKLDGIPKNIDYLIDTKRGDLNTLISKNRKKQIYELKNKFFDELNIQYATNLSQFYDEKGNRKKTDEKLSKKFNLAKAIKFITLINNNKKIVAKKAIVKVSKKEKIEDVSFQQLNNSTEKLINLMIKNLGKSIIKNNNKIELKEFYYLLKFNYQGFPLNKNIIINKNNTRIINKFNRNLLIIKINKYYYAFNSNTLNFIGYYEKNKPLIISKIKTNYLIPQYSIYEKVLYMGIPYFKYTYNSNEVNEFIKERNTNVSYFINSLISNLNLKKQKDPKLNKLETIDVNNDFEYVFKNIIDFNKKKYLKYMIKDNKSFSLDEIINYSKEINNLHYNFIENMINLLELNKSIQTNICDFYVDIINKNFKKFNQSKYNSDEIKFNMILESEAFLIGDIDTGIGFYGDLNLVDKLTEEEKEEQENEKLDDEYRDEALDTDQLVEDEQENEDMGDEDVQYTEKDN
jgi:hypothetical protein